MKILFINQFFPPDLAPTGQLLADVTRYLSEQGHDVTVICSESVYAEGGLPTRPVEKVLRVKGMAFRRSLLGRSACYLSFLFEALRSALRMKNVDIVVTLTTPPLLPLVGAILKRAKGCRFFTWEMDLFPESLVTMGLLPSQSVLTGLFRRIADFPRRRADGIIVLGPCMHNALVEHGLPPQLIRVAENWSQGAAAHPPLPRNPWITVLYSGNLGACHDTDTICDAMVRLQADARIRFVFAGGGVKRRLLEDRCRQLGITRAEFVAYADSAEYAARLTSADICLVTQTDASLGAVVPSKLYSFMAFGRPVLFVGPSGSTVAQVISGNSCGWHVPCGASTRLAQLLEQLADDRSSITTAASNARGAYLRQYTAESGTARIAEILGVVPQVSSVSVAMAGS